jgi:hypothetical protein
MSGAENFEKCQRDTSPKKERLTIRRSIAIKREGIASIHFYLFIWTNYDAVGREIARWARARSKQNKKKKKELKEEKTTNKINKVCGGGGRVHGGCLVVVAWQQVMPATFISVCVCVYISWAIEKTFRSCEGRPDSKEKRPWPETDPSKSIKTKLAFLLHH